MSCADSVTPDQQVHPRDLVRRYNCYNIADSLAPHQTLYICRVLWSSTFRIYFGRRVPFRIGFRNLSADRVATDQSAVKLFCQQFEIILNFKFRLFPDLQRINIYSNI